MRCIKQGCGGGGGGVCVISAQCIGLTIPPIHPSLPPPPNSEIRCRQQAPITSPRYFNLILTPLWLLILIARDNGRAFSFQSVTTEGIPFKHEGLL